MENSKTQTKCSRLFNNSRGIMICKSGPTLCELRWQNCNPVRSIGRTDSLRHNANMKHPHTNKNNVTCIRSSPVRPRWLDGRTESSRCKRTMRTPLVYIIFAVLAYINRTYAYQRDRRTDTTHRQTDLKTSVRSGPALVGGRTDKQCTQELRTSVFCL